MTPATYQQRWWRRPVLWLASSRVGASFLAASLHHLDRLIFRLTGGRTSATALLTGLPLIMLTTTGAKSGQSRTVPLLGILDGDDLVLIASNWGGRRHPAWYHNLCAHPEATVAINGRSTPYTAREVAGAEREACWQKATALYPGYNAYTKRTGGRPIPVLRLTPNP